MARYCGNCGTEVDDTAVFCPTCGQPIDAGASADIPAAPAWPEPEPELRERSVEDDASERLDQPQAARWDEPAPAPDAGAWERRAPASEDVPTRVEAQQVSDDPSVPPPIPPSPPAVARPQPGRAPDDDRRSSAGPQVELPFTMPVTLSGWLIGIGSVLAVLGLIVVLIGTGINVIDLLLLVALLGVAATVFLSAQMPAIPHLRLICLVVALIAFGVALDRVGVRGGGAGELLLFMGTAAAAIGAVVLELGQDQPLAGPQR